MRGALLRGTYPTLEKLEDSDSTDLDVERSPRSMRLGTGLWSCKFSVSVSARKVPGCPVKGHINTPVEMLYNGMDTHMCACACVCCVCVHARVCCVCVCTSPNVLAVGNGPSVDRSLLLTFTHDMYTLFLEVI
jgi:hypothetical protein